MNEDFIALLGEFHERFPVLELAPWDPLRAARRYRTASHGERLAIAFLLGVWNPSTKWRGVKRFDLFEAAHVLGSGILEIIARWTARRNGAEDQSPEIRFHGGVVEEAMMEIKDGIETMLDDLGVQADYNGRYPGWLLEMAQRLVDAGWKR